MLQVTRLHLDVMKIQNARETAADFSSWYSRHASSQQLPVLLAVGMKTDKALGAGDQTVAALLRLALPHLKAIDHHLVQDSSHERRLASFHI